MTREEKIKAIYEKIAQVKSIFIEVCPSCYSKNIGFSNNKEYRNKCKDCNDLFHNPTEIEGEEFKEVMIGDVLDYIEDDDFFETITDIQKDLLDLWEYKIKPIEEQSEECIDYTYNLIK